MVRLPCGWLHSGERGVLLWASANASVKVQFVSSPNVRGI
jgi:hypothetical protein